MKLKIGTRVGMLLTVMTLATISYGADYVWNGSASDGDWVNAANWDGGSVPASLSAESTVPDTVTFDGANMPSVNVATFMGNHLNDSATMNFNSGGAFTLDVSTSLNGGPISTASRTWLTIGDGIGGAADVTVNITNMASTLRHASVAFTNQVNADGVLNVNGTLQGYGNPGARGAIFELNGGSMTADSIQTKYSEATTAYISFVAVGSSLTVGYGGSYADFSAVTTDLPDNFRSSLGIALEFIDNETSFSVTSSAALVAAVINTSTNIGMVPLEVEFSGTDSFHSAAEIASYNWDFGDGNTDSGGVVTHTYTTVGEYTAMLTVVDALGNSDSTTVTITVEALPMPGTNIALRTDADNSSAAAYETNIEALLTDTFDYDPTYPAATLPSLDYKDGFHAQEENDVDAILSFILNEAYTTDAEYPHVAMDLWGRDRNQERDDNIDVIFYNGDYSTEVGRVEGISIPDVPEAYARALIDTLAIGTTFDRVQIIGHDTTTQANNQFCLTEVRLAAISGDPDSGWDQTISLTNGNVLVWSTTGVVSYDVEYREDLAYGDWLVYTNVMSTPPTTSVEFPFGRVDAEFFQVKELK